MDHQSAREAQGEHHLATAEVTPTTQHAQVESCAICLCPITERAVAVPCNHLSFDFLCLVQWLQSSARCPLCKQTITEVQYDFRSVDDFKRYVVPQALLLQDIPASSSEPYRPAGDEDTRCHRHENAALERRRRVYEHQLYSSHVGSNAQSGYSDFSPEVFSASTMLQARARVFLRRELQVSQTYAGRGSQQQEHKNGSRLRLRQATTDYLIEFIVAVLRAHDPKSFDGRAEELLMDFMPISDARLLLHELSQWLRSPFTRLDEWDEAVQY